MATYIEQEHEHEDSPVDFKQLDWVLFNKETGEFLRGTGESELEVYINKEIQANRTPTKHNTDVFFVYCTLDLM